MLVTSILFRSFRALIFCTGVGTSHTRIRRCCAKTSDCREICDRGRGAVTISISGRSHNRPGNRICRQRSTDASHRSRADIVKPLATPPTNSPTGFDWLPGGVTGVRAGGIPTDPCSTDLRPTPASGLASGTLAFGCAAVRDPTLGARPTWEDVRPFPASVVSSWLDSSWRPAPAKVKWPSAKSCHGLYLRSRPSGPSADSSLLFAVTARTCSPRYCLMPGPWHPPPSLRWEHLSNIVLPAERGASGS